MTTTTESTTEQAALTLEIDGDGVAWLIFDEPSSRVNILTSATMSRLDTLLGEVEEGARAGRLKALVVRSGKPDTFIAGADVNEIAGITDPADGAAQAQAGQRVFRRLERVPIPSIAAIDGACLGGGTELALACGYRLASDRPETRIGLPEVRLGIVPGFGGTVRLPRLVGLRAALEMIVTGRPVGVRRAERIGLIDERVPPALLHERAQRFAWERIDRGPLRRRRRSGISDRLLDDTAPGRRLVLWQARRRALRETRGNYPAPLAAIDALAETLSLPLDRAFEREAQAVGSLVAGPVSKNLIHIFQLTNAAKKAAPAAPARTVERAAVIGAGTMGGEIAQVLAARGVAVRLKDIDADALARGLRHARGLFDKAVGRGRMGRRDADRAFARIAPTLDDSGFGAVDLVIEAVVEKLDVKKEVLRGIEAQARTDAVLTSNTSSLSITEMQHVLERPENFCGMHFFNPVHRMPLVEIVRGAATSDEAVAAVFGVVRRLDKTAVIVNDGPGFLVNRLLAPYLNEAGWLLADGASVEAVDRALVDFGMPMGPFRLLDEVGLDVSRHVGAIMYEAFGDRLRPAPPLVALGETGRLGRKGRAGFYAYEDGKEKGPDHALYTELRDAVPATRRELEGAVIQDRLLLAMVNEAARALDDGIVDAAGEVDLALVMGIGFPPFRGGLLRYADALGARWILDKLEAMERTYGPRFHPAPRLRRLADTGAGFYD